MEINEAKQKINQRLSIIKELSGKQFGPADINVIEKFEKENGIELPEIYKYFLLKCDGIYDLGFVNTYEFVDEDYEEEEMGDIYSISEFIEKYTLMRERASSPIPKEIIPYHDEPYNDDIYCMNTITRESYKWCYGSGELEPIMFGEAIESVTIDEVMISELDNIGRIHLFDKYKFISKKLRGKFEELADIDFCLFEDEPIVQIVCDGEDPDDVLKFVKKNFKDFDSEIDEDECVIMKLH